MGEYIRTTRECSLDSMRPELAATIRDRIEKYDINDIEASALFCCETISTNQKKRLFGRKTEVVQTGIILTPLWLIWRRAEKMSPQACLQLN